MSNIIYRTNHNITAKEVRLLNEDGTQVGVVTILEARNQASQLGTDLVEIAPHAVPPVVKLIDFKKFKYQLAKKEAAEKKKQKGGELKEIVLKPFMAENDFSHRLKRVREFLEDNNKVRLVVKFKGLQLGSKTFGYEILSKAAQATSDISMIDQPAKFLGRQILMTLTPVKNKSETKSSSQSESEDSKK